MAETKKAKDAAGAKYDGFTEDERSAMKERAKELKSATTKKSGKSDEADLLAKLEEMVDADRAIGERVHAIIKANAPELTPTLWYGMPAYSKGGKVVCFFQPAAKFKGRYSTLGFSDPAALDDGNMWATSFALTKLTKADEKQIAELVKKAAG